MMICLRDLSKPDCSLVDGCIKLLISRRPPGPTWIQLKLIFLCTTSLKPTSFLLHSASPIADVKMQLLELPTHI